MEEVQQRRTFYDLVPDDSLYPVSIVSCLTCLVLFKYVSPFLSSRLWKDYCRLPEGVRLDWDTRVVSTIHATIVSLLALYSHLYDDDMHANLIWWDCTMVRVACGITVGYMVSDLAIITVYYHYMGDTVYYFHHSASAFAYYYVVSYPVMPFYANFRLLSEISTPFLNFRWFILTMGYLKYGHASIANLLLLYVSFFFCRVLAIPLYWFKVHEVSQMDGFYDTGYIPAILVVTCVILDALNSFWFVKLSQTLLRSMKAYFRSSKVVKRLSLVGTNGIVGHWSQRRAAKRVKAG